MEEKRGLHFFKDFSNFEVLFTSKMKTILVIISGLADLPETSLGGKTPLMLANSPALDALAKCGCSGTMKVCPEGVSLTRANALLSLLGYDFAKGEPDSDALERFGKSDSVSPEDYNLRCFVVPRFSGRGVIISSHAEVRGIGKLAMLKAIDPGEIKSEGMTALQNMASLALSAIETEEFVVIHVESAAAMSRKHDPDGKRRAIEQIDSDVVCPIADYVWNAREQMNMVVVSDTVYPWRKGYPVEGEVPAVVYFNDDLPYDTPRFDEGVLEEGPLNVPLPGDLIKLLISFEPVFEDDGLD